MKSKKILISILSLYPMISLAKGIPVKIDVDFNQGYERKVIEHDDLEKYGIGSLVEGDLKYNRSVSTLGISAKYDFFESNDVTLGIGGGLDAVMKYSILGNVDAIHNDGKLYLSAPAPKPNGNDKVDDSAINTYINDVNEENGDSDNGETKLERIVGLVINKYNKINDGDDQDEFERVRYSYFDGTNPNISQVAALLNKKYGEYQEKLSEYNNFVSKYNINTEKAKVYNNLLQELNKSIETNKNVIKEREEFAKKYNITDEESREKAKKEIEAKLDRELRIQKENEEALEKLSKEKEDTRTQYSKTIKKDSSDLIGKITKAEDVNFEVEYQVVQSTYDEEKDEVVNVTNNYSIILSNEESDEVQKKSYEAVLKEDAFVDDFTINYIKYLRAGTFSKSENGVNDLYNAVYKLNKVKTIAESLIKLPSNDKLTDEKKKMIETLISKAESNTESKRELVDVVGDYQLYNLNNGIPGANTLVEYFKSNTDKIKNETLLKELALLYLYNQPSTYKITNVSGEVETPDVKAAIASVLAAGSDRFIDKEKTEILLNKIDSNNSNDSTSKFNKYNKSVKDYENESNAKDEIYNKVLELQNDKTFIGIDLKDTEEKEKGVENLENEKKKTEDEYNKFKDGLKKDKDTQNSSKDTETTDNEDGGFDDNSTITDPDLSKTLEGYKANLDEKMKEILGKALEIRLLKDKYMELVSEEVKNLEISTNEEAVNELKKSASKIVTFGGNAYVIFNAEYNSINDLRLFTDLKVGINVMEDMIFKASKSLEKANVKVNGKTYVVPKTASKVELNPMVNLGLGIKYKGFKTSVNAGYGSSNFSLNVGYEF